MPKNDIPAKIFHLRKKHNLTLEEVAKVVGVGKSTVRKWENGIISNMRRDKIALLAKALHTTPSDLMGWEDETPAPDLSESERVWIELYRKLSPDVRETFVTLVEKFDALPDGERQMLLAMIRGAIGAQAE